MCGLKQMRPTASPTMRPMREPQLNPSPSPGDAVHSTTCYMCACRCGIRVWTLEGRIRYIQGNPDHPVNRGVLCAKGSAGIMQHYSPARLTRPPVSYTHLRAHETPEH